MTEEYPVKNLGESEPDLIKPMLIGALIAFVLGAVPFVNLVGCLCIPQIAGAMVAIHLYTKSDALTISIGKGIMIGIGASLIGGLLAYVVNTGLDMMGINPMKDIIMEVGRKFVEQSGDPNAIEQFNQRANHKPEGGELVFQLLIGLVSTVVFSAIGGVIGGAIGASVFKRAPEEDEGVV